jgi:hypothetical protein
MRSNMETAGTNLDVDFISLEGAIAFGSGTSAARWTARSPRTS